MIMPLIDITNTCHARLDTIFNAYLKHTAAAADDLQQAMHYSVTNGGKRIRPLMVYAVGHALGASWETLDAPACAIEFIHAYSLIHDDLPAMDNADKRRGKPSCHIAFSEATAVLAGDALQTLAFEIIASHPADLHPNQRLAMTKLLSQACGLHGMAGGQALDIAGYQSLEELKKMYRLKTGALLTGAIKLGAIAANINDKEILSALETYGNCLGLAFQIQDDLMDGSQKSNKTMHLDKTNNKKTYVSITGVEKAHEQLKELYDETLDAIKPLGKKATPLKELAEFLSKRDN